MISVITIRYDINTGSKQKDAVYFTELTHFGIVNKTFVCSASSHYQMTIINLEWFAQRKFFFSLEDQIKAHSKGKNTEIKKCILKKTCKMMKIYFMMCLSKMHSYR